jgi:hypothetical protein
VHTCTFNLATELKAINDSRDSFISKLHRSEDSLSWYSGAISEGLRCGGMMIWESKRMNKPKEPRRPTP